MKKFLKENKKKIIIGGILVGGIIVTAIILKNNKKMVITLKPNGDLDMKAKIFDGLEEAIAKFREITEKHDTAAMFWESGRFSVIDL